MMNVVWSYVNGRIKFRLSVPANMFRACQMRTQQLEYRCSTDSVCDLLYPDTIGYWNFTYGTDAKFSTGAQ